MFKTLLDHALDHLKAGAYELARECIRAAAGYAEDGETAARLVSLYVDADTLVATYGSYRFVD